MHLREFAASPGTPHQSCAAKSAIAGSDVNHVGLFAFGAVCGLLVFFVCKFRMMGMLTYVHIVQPTLKKKSCCSV